jgi:DNA-binding CsgD family transcriptional regulator
MSEAIDLDPLAIALYRRVLNQPEATVDQLAAALEHPADKLDKHLARLTDMGVLRTEDGEHFSAISPMLAEATVLGSEDLELAARRADLEMRRNSIRQLVPEWNLTLTARSSEQAIDVITEPGEAANVLMHYADQVQNEVLSISPGRQPPARVDGRTNTANHFALKRGIRIRALYQETALEDSVTVDYLRDLTENGAKIRFSHAVPGRLLIIDQNVALLPLPLPNSERRGLAVVHEPHLLRWLASTFEQLWNGATILEDYLANHQDFGDIEPIRRAILRLMADGDKDEAIARKLSVSVRTARRHIADYMTQVRANSRFQAGVIAARAGHIDQPDGEAADR